MKSGEKWGNVGKVGKSGEKCGKWGKVTKSWKKLEKVGKVGKRVFLNFGQNGRRRPFWMSENNFRSQFLPFQIDTQLFFFLKFLDKNGRQRPFWIVRQCQLSNSSEIFG